MAAATRADPPSSDCASTRAFQLGVIEAAVVGGLRERMVDRDGISLYMRIYNEEWSALAADSAIDAPRSSDALRRPSANRIASPGTDRDS